MKKWIAKLRIKWPYLDAVVNMLIGSVTGGCFSEIIHNINAKIQPYASRPVLIILLISIGIAFLYNKYLGINASPDIVSKSMQQHVSEIIDKGDVKGAKDMKDIIDTLGLPSMRDVMSNKTEETSQNIEPRDVHERRN